MPGSDTTYRNVTQPLFQSQTACIYLFDGGSLNACIILLT